LRIIDAHVHFPLKSGLQVLIESYDKVGVEKCFMCSLPRSGQENAAVEGAMNEYPDLIKGFAYVDLDVDEAEKIESFYSRGFTGIKLITPQKSYEWEGYFAFYERIEKYKMPVILHTGIVTRGIKITEKGITSSKMRPVYLETIARSFPKIVLIGAHLGHPWCEEAAVVSFHNSNVYFDVSGAHTFYVAQTIQSRFGYDLKSSKLLFGTDSSPEEFQKNINYWQMVLPQLGFKNEDLGLFFYENASKILSGTEN